MFEFAWWPVFILLPLPLILARMLPATKQQHSPALMNTSLPMLAKLAQHPRSPWQQRVNMVVWALLVIALSRPQWISEQAEPIIEQGRDLMIAVDMSGSMQIKDLEQNGVLVDRLSIVKSLLSEFIEARRGDRLGLILFADQAYLASPLSFDLNQLLIQVDELVHGLVGEATAIGEAIGQGVKQLLNQDNPQRVLILLTDGQNTAGSVSPLDAAKIASEHDVVIYTIGIGADELYQRSLFGQRKINPSADLDEASLKQIASLTQGQYFRARSREDLAQIYQTISELNPMAQDEQFYRPKDELYYLPLLVALLIMLSQNAAPHVRHYARLLQQRFAR